eukprot:16434360-Heterocapsa_arctica.AAC.1
MPVAPGQHLPSSFQLRSHTPPRQARPQLLPLVGCAMSSKRDIAGVSFVAELQGRRSSSSADTGLTDGPPEV